MRKRSRWKIKVEVEVLRQSALTQALQTRHFYLGPEPHEAFSVRILSSHMFVCDFAEQNTVTTDP